MVVFLIVLASIIGLFVIFSLIMAIIVTHFTVHPKIISREEIMNKNAERGFLVGTESMERIPVDFKMKDNYLIHGDFSKNTLNHIVICCHGHVNNREGCMKYARIFYKLGFSVLLFDQRGQGVNEKNPVTMGKKEAEDLFEIYNQIKIKYPDHSIGIFGFSMGASTALIFSKYTQNVDFLIADCPYSSLYREFCETALSHKLIPYLAALFTNIFIKIGYHFSFKDVRPMVDIKENKVPVLLIHGAKDDIVNVKNQKVLLDNMNCYHENYIFEEAKHDNCVNVDGIRYENIVKTFLYNINFKL